MSTGNTQPNPRRSHLYIKGVRATVVVEEDINGIQLKQGPIYTKVYM